MMSAQDGDTRLKTVESDSDSEIDRKFRVDNTKDRHWSNKQYLIKECQDAVGTISSGKNPLNIAIIGPPGCGKSSLLNTIFASFNDKSWKQVAEHGNSVTRKKYYNRKGQNSGDDDILMPTFIDMSGFEDEDTKVNRELLNMVFFGRLTEYEKIKDVLFCLTDDGINGTRRKYGTRNEYLLVDRIIFVCSLDPDAPLPTNLMECVRKVSKDVRGIPVFGVMTKADKFDAKRNDKVQEREKKFREHLGIPLERFTRIKNYCEDIDKETSYRYHLIPKIDVAILELMNQVFSSSIEVSNPGGRPDNSDPTKKELSDSGDDVKPVPVSPRNGRPKSYSCINFPKLLILITIQVMLVAMILHFGFKPIITDEKVNTICANYDFIKSKHDATIDGLGELCEHKDDIFKPPINLLGGAIVLVIAVPQMVFNFFFAISSA
ncbi:unnamed protein product [Mytilus edulis]|uniref:G domain-containing protein n=1 Tax=Mytilus edulis TaxID=6550 RepID=A0A8S3UI14_MYTED|nr:unnamed protein product [Mytilus edulis]